MRTEFVWRNLDEFLKNIREVEKRFPDLATKYVRRMGNTLKRKAIDASPRGKAPLFRFKKGKLKTNRSKLYLSWTGSTEGGGWSTVVWNGGAAYKLRSKAPHYHLVERGHEQYYFGHYTGFTAGKFFFAKAVDSFERSDEWRQIMEKFYEEIKQKMLS